MTYVLRTPAPKVSIMRHMGAPTQEAGLGAEIEARGAAAARTDVSNMLSSGTRRGPW